MSLALTLLVTACGPSGSKTAQEEAVRDHVEETIAALESGDLDTIRSVAPEFGEFGDKAATAIVETFRSSRIEWSVDAVEIDGREATARIMITSGDEDETQTIRLPLRWRDDRWEFVPRISVEQHYDHVPIE